MHHVEGLLGHARQHDRPRGGLALEGGGARESVVLGLRLALGHELVLELDDHVAVLGVHRHEGVEGASRLHDLDQLDVVDADGAAVGHEGLEGGDALLLDTGLHPVGGLVTPPGDRHVEGVVRHRLGGLVVPGGEGIHQVLVPRGDHEVDDRRRSPGYAGCCAGLEVVGGDRAHEGQLHVDVGVEAAGEDVLAGGVDHLLALALEVRADLDDLAAARAHVAHGLVEGGDDRPVLDQDAHGFVSRLGVFRAGARPCRGRSRAGGRGRTARHGAPLRSTRGPCRR